MAKKRTAVKDGKIGALLKKGGRMGAKEDFFELLRRAVFPGKRV